MHLLDNYTIDAHTRYESHRLIYTPENEEPIVLGGILGAAILAALLVDTDEGDARNIALDTDAERAEFFARYEKEVRRDNGGLFLTEVWALNEAYLEFTGDEELIMQICRNDRLYDLAIGLTIEYMQRLVREEVCEQIYDLCPWTGPFAQWLFNAGPVETRRQKLLSIDWTDAAEVYALSEELNDNQLAISGPTFVFEGMSAEQVLNGYWRWLWETAQTEANLYPDAKVRLAEYKQIILEQETDYDFLKPEMKDFTPEQLNLFRSWMNQWIDFVKHKITCPEEESFPEQHKSPRIKQVLFPDKYMTCPAANKYADTRDYIMERCRYDAEFKNFILSHTIAELCDQLSLMFGWYVIPNHLGKRFKKAQIS